MRVLTPLFPAVLSIASVAQVTSPVSELPPPNILWITSEDNGPHLGAYGDTFADTPQLDALATRGMIYTNAWSNAPVCAPARTTIIMGMYPTTLGAEHMRSLVGLPEGILMYPQYLRRAGYYTTNNVKEDYNLIKPENVWHESSSSADWRNRPDGSQPFFAVFNFTDTHESQIRSRPHTPVHDPDRVPIPAYHPDTPEVRLDWAQYYDKMTVMDAKAGEVLRRLEEDGLEERTIIFYYGDHGPGMPRSKRWPYDSGLRVPLIIYIPEMYRHLATDDWRRGGAVERPVAFVDLAPTVLSLAGIQPPGHMQGHAFLGRYAGPAGRYNFGFRGRMDERYDLVRSVRDERFVYIRNYRPDKVYGQFLAYMFQTPTTQVWKQLFDEGALNPVQAAFWQTKPSEELYDLVADPNETINLADSPAHREIRDRLSGVLRAWILASRDLGFLPEAEMHERAGGAAPYLLAMDAQRYPLERILDAADLATLPGQEDGSALVRLLSDDDSAVRYWGVTGLLIRGEPAVLRERAVLLGLLDDASASVRIAAAEALGRFGMEEDARRAVDVLLGFADAEQNGTYLAVQALNALDAMGARADSARDRIAALPDADPNVDGRMRDLVLSLKERILSRAE